jgi:alpha-tubulin suppressor-like RCC1 family protein
MLRKQKWAFLGGLILLAICMVIPGAAVMASGSTIAVSGTIPLIISNVQVTNITTTSATISWNTNNPSGSSVTSQVSYGITIGYGSGVSNTSSGLHSVNLSSLSAGTKYYYQIQSTISGIPPAIYSNYFTTAGLPFVPPPSTTKVIWAWGLNGNGQLGDGTNNIISNVPVEDNLPAGVTAISAGDDFSLALTSNGTVWAWGCTNQTNDNGVLGNGTNTGSQIPVQVSMPAGVTVTAIAAGHDFSLALTSTGTVWAWGYGIDGELGNGFSTNSNVPVQVSMPSVVKVTAISAGGGYSLALTSGGKVWAWGYGIDGELGNGANTSSNIPVQVSIPSGITITAIAAGHDSGLALVSDGTVLAWGYNGNGELGNGNNANSNIPVSVKIPPGITVTAIAAGYRHNLALTSGGAILAWGDNVFGELGNGNNTNSNIPVQVSMPSGVKVTAIAAAGDNDFSLALTSGGMVWSWGYGIDGELGNGNNANSNIPVQVSMPAGAIVTKIASGGSHSLALVSTTTATSTGINSLTVQSGGSGSPFVKFIRRFLHFR